MKAHTYLLRTLLLGAIGGGFWACSSDVETCDSCSDPSGDGDGDAGDGDVGDGDTGDGDAGDGDSNLRGCTSPVAIEGHSWGLVSCDEGYSHRPESLECPNLLPRDVVIEWPDIDAGAGGVGGAGDVLYTTSADECSTDADCGDLEYCALVMTNDVTPNNNFCDAFIGPEQPTPDFARLCQSAGSGCVTDADCGTNQLCICGEFAGTCADVGPIAGCRTDEDCEGEALCVATYGDDNFGPLNLACQLEGDLCNINSDCAANEYCALTTEAGRTCRGAAVCGRPFLVFGDTRLASVEKNSNWPADVCAAILPENVDLRRALASHFAHIGLMEHASIAAFARFTLQLLSLGAPAEFIEASNAAQVDETRHARLAFALASTYAGESPGPGALSLDRVLEETSWEAIFEATVREGCIGETRAALEANWAAESCDDPVVRTVLEGIAADETRHAELAWRVVAWMIGQRPELAESAERIFKEVELVPKRDATRPESGSSWGVLSNDELRACWKDAWNEVITPCARVLGHGRAGENATQVAVALRSDPQRSGGHTAPRA